MHKKGKSSVFFSSGLLAWENPSCGEQKLPYILHIYVSGFEGHIATYKHTEKVSWAEKTTIHRWVAMPRYEWQFKKGAERLIPIQRSIRIIFHCCTKSPRLARSSICSVMAPGEKHAPLPFSAMLMTSHQNIKGSGSRSHPWTPRMALH